MKLVFEKPSDTQHKSILQNFIAIITEKDTDWKWGFKGTIWRDEEDPEKPGNITYGEIRVGQHKKKVAAPEKAFEQLARNEILLAYKIHLASQKEVFKG